MTLIVGRENWSIENLTFISLRKNIDIRKKTQILKDEQLSTISNLKLTFDISYDYIKGEFWLWKNVINVLKDVANIVERFSLVFIGKI